MTANLSGWTPRQRPESRTFEGRFARLEPLEAARHGDGLFAASTAADAAGRFRWLPEDPPASRADFQSWLERVEASEDPLYFAVIDRASGHVAGRQTLMRMDPAHGVVEIGNIYWGPAIARTPATTEALLLFGCHVFDDLGYRRFEWKCNALNTPSRRAAERFGFSFEGVFRQHMVVKGENRDTAWYAMLDGDWPAARAGLEAWLDPANFDTGGRQRRRLEDIRVGIAAGE